MLEPRGREMRQIVLLHGQALRVELVQHRLHIHRVPDHYCIRHQIETQCLVRLGFLLFAADDPFIGDKKKITERVEGFPFVELGIDPSAVVGVFQVAQDEECLEESSIFLQGAGEDVLPGLGLQLADEERGGHPAPLQRSSESQQIIPMPQNEVLPDGAFDPRR